MQLGSRTAPPGAHHGLFPASGLRIASFRGFRSCSAPSPLVCDSAPAGRQLNLAVAGNGFDGRNPDAPRPQPGSARRGNRGKADSQPRPDRRRQRAQDADIMGINAVLTERQDATLTPPRRRRRRAPRSRGAHIGYRIIATAIALLLWQLAVVSGIASASAVASPTSIVRVAGPLLSSAQFGTALTDTIMSWAEGLFVSLLIAIPAGILLGTSDLAYRMSRFTIDFLRTIPPVALIPLALLLYGATPKMAFALIVFGSVWPLLLQSMYGVHQVDPAARDVARSYRLSKMDRARFIVLPSAAPFVATGIRLAATISLLLAVGSEIIGGAPGIGNAITLQNQAGNVPAMWVYIVVSAVLGVVANLALIGLERRVLKWHSAHRSADVA